MSKPINQDEINMIIWKACDTFRGAVDPSEYKNYILTMLFVKYLSDLWKERRALLRGAVRRQPAAGRAGACRRSGSSLPPESDFDFLYAKREAPNIGELINIALENIEDAQQDEARRRVPQHRLQLGIRLGQTRERNRRLKSLLEDFNDPRLDLRPTTGPRRNDIIGDVYEYLIGRFAAGAGKKAGEFYTPPEVSKLLARLVRPKPGDRICDPACGSGSLLIRVAKEIREPGGSPSKNFSLYGQESNGSTWALCRMNMFLHGMDAARIEWCDTISQPQADRRRQADEVRRGRRQPAVLARQVGAEDAAHDRYNRFWRGVPPKSKGDYAFITHMIETPSRTSGRVGVIVPHGVLFRGGAEGLIRQKLIEENLLDAVIGLPANLFFGTGIPAAILIFNKGKKTTDVLFIDASREYQDDKKQNRLRAEGHRPSRRPRSRRSRPRPKYAHRATTGRDPGERVQPEHPAVRGHRETESRRSTSTAVQAEIDDLERRTGDDPGGDGEVPQGARLRMSESPTEIGLCSAELHHFRT